MGDIEKLKEQIAREKAKAEVEKDFKERNAERKRLESELKTLKARHSISAKFASGLKKVGTDVQSGLKKFGVVKKKKRTAQPRIRQPTIQRPGVVRDYGAYNIYGERIF